MKSRERVCHSNWLLVTVMVTMLMTTAAYGRGKEKVPVVVVDAACLLMPLDGAFNVSAGTLEARFALDYSFDDYLRPSTSGCVPFNFLQVYCNEKNSPNPKNSRPGFRIAMSQSQIIHFLAFSNNLYCLIDKTDPRIRYGSVTVASNKEKGPWFQAGEWHTVAVTWIVEKDWLRVQLFIDGILRNNQVFPDKLSDTNDFGKEDILGIGGETLSPATLLSYRLSNRVRTPVEIASDKPLVADADTTFFMNGESAEKIKILPYKSFDAMPQDKKFKITQPVFVGDIKIVNTPHGKAIQFYKKRSR